MKYSKLLKKEKKEVKKKKQDFFSIRTKGAGDKAREDLEKDFKNNK